MEYIIIGILVIIIIYVLLITFWAYSGDKKLNDSQKYALCAYAAKDPGKTIENYYGSWIDEEDNDDIDLDEYEQFIVVGRRYIKFNIKDGDSLFCNICKINTVKDNEFYIIDRGNKFDLRLGREIKDFEIKEIIAKVIYLSKKK